MLEGDIGLLVNQILRVGGRYSPLANQTSGIVERCTLLANQISGVGGRCQELGLSAAIALSGYHGNGSASILVTSTDGQVNKSFC